MSNLSTLQIPDTHLLKESCRIVPDAAWQSLVNYILTQTSTINSVLNTIENMSRLQDNRYIKLCKDIETLATATSEIAQALEGVYSDE